MKPLNQTISGGENNIQAGRDILFNPVINVINVSYSDIQTFDKVLHSIAPENFIKEVFMPFMEIHKDLKKENILTDLEALLMHRQ